jgi:hypothetical protein
MGKFNFIKIPSAILEKVNGLDTDDVIVATVKKIKPSETGRLARLGISRNNGQIVIRGPFLPEAHHGKFSRYNIHGRVKVRRDLPKREKSWSIEAPSWGSTSDTHTIIFGKPCYQRQLIRPKNVTLSVELLGEEPDGTVAVKVAVDQVLRKTMPDFKDELFYNLNLLQENVGASDVYASGTTLEQFEAQVKLTWQILPPGKIAEILARMVEGKQGITDEIKGEMTERMGILQLFGVKNWITGSDGFLRYFGAQYEDNLVAFENTQYGNALYVMFEDWPTLSRRSRIDLLKGSRDGFVRIVHSRGWPDRLKHALQDYRDGLRRKVAE